MAVTVRLIRSAAVAAVATALLSTAALPARAADDPGLDGSTGLSSAGSGESGSSAGAEDSGTVSVTPAVVAAGADVQIRVRGCKGGRGVATSEAFVADAQLAAATDGDDGSLAAEATVRSTTEPGNYKISCGDCGAEGTFTVVSESDSGGYSHDSHGPTAPVHAGGGGTAKSADDGPGSSEVMLGLGLAGGAAVAFAGIAAHRRRSSARASD